MKKTIMAFTLAEVLITLAIIGVVAALTIPVLIENIQNQEYVTALDKFYSEANQAFALTGLDECGSTDSIKCFDTTQNMENAIASHFKKLKDCKYLTGKKCWAKYNYNYDGSGGTFSADYQSGYYKFITADGMSVMFYTNDETCSPDEDSTVSPYSPMHNLCGMMYVDVNGLKGPNREGRDVFSFDITSNKIPLLYPQGGKDDYYWKDNGCKADNTIGWVCAGRIMEAGWKMDY